jgi:two-component system sensor histidine kinase FlrB
MLPTSHFAPIVSRGLEAQVAPLLSSGAETSTAVLADAFNAFMATAGRMEASYGQLQAEIAQLRSELEDRNAALTRSLEENSNIRQALQRILEALPCGVIVLDHSGIVLINPEARRLLELSGSESTLEELSSHIQLSLRSAIDREDEHEFALENSAGKTWMSVRRSETPVRHEQDGEMQERSILILRDITAHKKAELQRERSRNMVSLGEMAAVLAHEIRNPLSSLELWTGLLAKQPAADDEARFVVENLQAGVRSISATINNILQFHNSGTVHHVPLKLLPVLQSSVAFVRPLADQAGIKLTLRAPLGDREISGDPNGLQQVILNIAINAFRHTPRGGSFTIDAHLVEDGQTVRISFADTGEGILEADMPHLFESKLDRTTNGPGLGLIICRRVVEQHGGRIGAESQRGVGTTFFVELPIL